MYSFMQESVTFSVDLFYLNALINRDNIKPHGFQKQSAPYGAGTLPILLDEVVCTGTENDIDQCRHSHTPIRLVGGPSVTEGRVEIQYKGQWGTVCANGFGQEEAQVICLMLGHGLGSPQYFLSAHFGSGSGLILLDDLACIGTEKDIALCKSNGWTNHNCGHSEDVSVVCSNARTPVRLVQGYSPGEGRVEVLYDNHWGTVCRTGFDVKDATVICNMLGYEISTPSVYSYTRFGQGDGPVWVSNLDCSGLENDISACKSAKWIPGSCSHNLDVSIACDLNVRLSNGPNRMTGRLELLRKNQDFLVKERVQHGNFETDVEQTETLHDVYSPTPISRNVTTIMTSVLYANNKNKTFCIIRKNKIK
ncbi:hypothetical protein KUTeg_015004 [Tegillarca granosa]|uniref:SRCR domain-containing protein n=1 Tax=Tegillarca granosa TaxID=220873 RepID=A0ABQ9EP26_TEGGR|nr:hypothetical protein KUTeg_015004 [Tegillarca granosa]